MQITELHAPKGGGTLYVGSAISAQGPRYSFYATLSGEPCAVLRENPVFAMPDGRSVWVSVKAPSALRRAVRQAVKAVCS